VYKDKIVLVVKGGSDEKIRPVAECVLSHRLECSLIPLSIDFARQDLKKVKEILGDKEIDVFSYARLPSGISKEQVFKNLATLKKEGLFREAGASELSASTLEIMHKVRLTPPLLSHFDTDGPADHSCGCRRD
jgi:pyridoxine 4-dehydrogenase